MTAACPAVEDVTGHRCRRLACDGAHSLAATDPWQPVAAAGQPPPVQSVTSTNPDHEEKS